MLSFCHIFVILWLSLMVVLAEEITTTVSLVPLLSTLPSGQVFQNIAIDTSTAAKEALDSDLKSDTATATSTTGANKSDYQESTPLWELIYPDQNSTIEDNTSNKPLIEHTLTRTSALTDETSSGTPLKYFKVDDIVNCEKYFGECLRQVLSKVMPKLGSGEETAQLPAIDPFYLNQTSFLYNGSPLNGRITMGHVFVHGITTMKYRKVILNRLNENSFKVRLSMVIPKIRAKGSYKADLKFNNVNVRPKGDFNITFYDVSVEQLAVAEMYEKDQHSFVKMSSLNATAVLRDAKINATGLIPDLRLNNIILNVASSYWREIFNIILPETRQNWSPIITNAINAALSMIPFDFLNK